MITEVFESQGSFDIKLRKEAPHSLLKTLTEFGHIVVLPQHVNHNLFSDASLLAMARYTGVVLGADVSNGGISLGGAGMVWHLGDQYGGPVIETEVKFTAAALSVALTGVLPTAITVGTITDTGVGAFSGAFNYISPLEAVRTIMATTNAHYRINPNGTLDSCSTTRDEVYVVTNPTVVVVRHGWGSDPSYKSVPSQRLTSKLDASSYATRSLVLDENISGEGFDLAGASTRGTIPYNDIHGNVLLRTFTNRRPADDTTIGAFTTTELGRFDIQTAQEVDTSQYEITDGSFSVGDYFLCYDPPSDFVDKTNEIRFRGIVIWPKKVRLMEATWPLVDGMGVYYRDKIGGYVDVTRWVSWEE